MTRRAVDITVDAYDAPTLAALAKRRDHQRALGHADDSTSRFSVGEVAEAIEARTTEERIYELLDVAAVCVRIASKMQRDLDAKGGE